MTKNESGINPTEFKVLVKLKPIEEKTAGGILLPEQAQDKEKFATMEGEIVAISHLAFGYATDEEWGDKRPKVGQRALFARYAGLHRKGKDGQNYVIMNDKDIIAIFEE